MAKTRRLTETEIPAARGILDEVRRLIAERSDGDAELAWAMRRYVYIRLQHDERGSPMQRKILKLKKMISQNGACDLCGCRLPERGAELDRIETMKGYTQDNTRLLCHDCHRGEQAKEGFAGKG